ncbi:hypothetical protein MMC28_005240 [Mycoblastus sanguinarius]|nr:hypothetical protein [Mycoblastus sanguinarius]
MDPSNGSTPGPSTRSYTSHAKRFRHNVSSRYIAIRDKLSNKILQHAHESRRHQIEDFPRGYPRFSRLFVAHPSFAISRKFLAMRARLLFVKQDHLSMLEERLDEIDHSEPRKMFLGNLRRDRNYSRKNVLDSMDKALRDYDQFVSRFRITLDASNAHRRDIVSLQNWIKGTGSINQAEASFLRDEEDLMSIRSRPDEAQSFFETCVVKAGVKISRIFQKYRKFPSQGLSRDPRVHISEGPFIRRLIQSLVAFIVVLLLFVPIVIITSVKSQSTRILIIVASTAIFILSMSGMTRAHTRELFIAGATYATVLVVFVAGNG